MVIITFNYAVWPSLLDYSECPIRTNGKIHIPYYKYFWIIIQLTFPALIEIILKWFKKFFQDITGKRYDKPTT